jgi:Loader and inhibitor of phage G40P
MRGNRADVAKLLRVLTAFYQQGIENPELTLDLWVRYFQEYPWRLVEAAVQKYTERGEVFPNPAMIRRVIVEMVDPIPPAEEGWREVVNGIRERGTYGIPVLSEFTWEVVRSLGGWYELNQKPSAKAGNDFMWAYRNLVQERRERFDPVEMIPLEWRGEEVPVLEEGRG